MDFGNGKKITSYIIKTTSEVSRMLSDKRLPQGLKNTLGVDEQGHLRTINQSLINETYCLSSDNERFLIKRFLADQSTGLSRRLLFYIQRKLAHYNIAPKPLYLCQENSVYAEQWVTPSVQSLSTLDSDQQMFHLASALATIHRLPLSTARMDLPAQWNGYARAANLSESDWRWVRAKELVFMAAASINSQQDLVFCHNDLAISHVLNYQQPMIIDWEYSRTGNRYFDIASTIAVNQLGAEQRKQLIAQYAEQFGFTQASVHEGVHRHEPLVTLTYQLWYAAITEHIKKTR
jgi:thiamine kinase-like enzyme